MVFSVALGWFPIGFSAPIGASVSDISLFERVRHVALPALTLSVTGLPTIALHTREKVVDVLESDYVALRVLAVNRVAIFCYVMVFVI